MLAFMSLIVSLCSVRFLLTWIDGTELSKSARPPHQTKRYVAVRMLSGCIHIACVSEVKVIAQCGGIVI